MVLDDVADIGIATESLGEVEGLATLPCYEWQHAIVMPRDHPLSRIERPTLRDIASHPLVSYHASFSGRTRVDQAFAQHQLAPRVVLEAIDADVIKTYVRLGLGVGIVAELAVRDEPADGDLVWKPVGHLFGRNTTRMAFKRGAYLRSYVFSFAQMLSDRLDRDLIARTVAAAAQSAAEPTPAPSDDPQI
jgi:LysR family cys regulon transcriptional activator